MAGNPPRKRFGQHFLHDPAILAKIVAVIAPRPGENLVEIGPGRGALTGPLLDAAGTLDVIEIDRDLAAELPDRVGKRGQLTIHCIDALKFDFATLKKPDTSLRIIGNLPYNISTPLLFYLLDASDLIQDMHFMVQKEVADRMTAMAGSRDYGRLSVMLAARCKAERLFTVGAGAFQPPPRVTSAFVRLTPFHEKQFPGTSDAVFARVVAQAFSMRRKQIRNSIGRWLDANALKAMDIDPSARPETLTPAQFARIAAAIDDE